VFIKRLLLAWLLVPLAFSYSQAVEYSLEDLYRVALERAERIRISEEDLYIAQTGKDKARSALLPKLSGVGSYTQFRESKASTSGLLVQPEQATTWGANLTQTLSLAGRELTAFNISKEGIEKSKYDLYAAKEGYLILVASAYYDVLRARKGREIAQANVDRLTKYREAAKIRLRVGEVTKTVLLRAEAELSGARSDLTRAENNLKLTVAVLARIVGIVEEFEVKEDFERRDTTIMAEVCNPPTVECLKEKASVERAELKSLGILKKIAEEQIRYAQGGHWPTLSVQGSYAKRLESPETSSLVKENLFGGVAITFPFFEGGLREAEVMEAGARKRQAEYALGDQKKSINIDVENAYLDFITQKGIMTSLKDQFTFAKDNYAAILKQFEFGLANSIDVMDANTLLVTAERQLADAVYNYQLSILKIDRVTGILLKSVLARR
jgi:outer membrane protein